MHLHLREGEMLKLVAPLSARSFAGAVIMPNLAKPVDSREKLEIYSQQIKKTIWNETFTPYMTLFFRRYSEAELTKVKYDIIGIKLYPAGITTNSKAGIRSLQQAEKTISIMQELDIPLLVHGESGGFVLDREKEFLPTYEKLAKKFPRLKIIMEHITTREAVKFLDRTKTSLPPLPCTICLSPLMMFPGGCFPLICSVSQLPNDRKTGMPS